MEFFDLWGQVGAYVPLDPPADKAAVKALAETAGVTRDEIRTHASLHVDGSRLRAEVDSVVVGWVPTDVAGGYLPVFESMARDGRTPRVNARVRVFDGYEPSEDSADGADPADLADRVGSWVSTYVALAEPHLVRPLNAPPAADFVELPEGRKQKVSVTASASSEHARSWIRPEGAGWMFCLLKPVTEQLARTTREVVQVWIDSVAVGTLTPAMSKNFLPLVKLVVASGRVTVARGLVKGNRLQIEMAVAALKSSEVTQAWLREHDLVVDAGA